MRACDVYQSAGDFIAHYLGNKKRRRNYRSGCSIFLRDRYASYEGPRRIWSSPAPRLWWAGSTLGLNSAGLVRSTTSSDPPECTAARDVWAGLHLRRALRDRYASYEGPRRIWSRPAPRLWWAGSSFCYIYIRRFGCLSSF